MNPLDQLFDQYKKGYKTSEFWVLIALGLTQALAAAFDHSKPLNQQLTNLTWVGISYILARSGLKVARATATGRVVAAQTASAPAAQLVSAVADGADDAGPAATNGSTGPNEAIDRQRALDLVEDVVEEMQSSPPATL